VGEFSVYIIKMDRTGCRLDLSDTLGRFLNAVTKIWLLSEVWCLWIIYFSNLLSIRMSLQVATTNHNFHLLNNILNSRTQISLVLKKTLCCCPIWQGSKNIRFIYNRPTSKSEFPSAVSAAFSNGTRWGLTHIYKRFEGVNAFHPQELKTVTTKLPPSL
jgi:hypothetical protein